MSAPISWGRFTWAPMVSPSSTWCPWRSAATSSLLLGPKSTRRRKPCWPRPPNSFTWTPAAPFLSSLHLAFYGGILLSSPFIFYFIAQFVLPALKVKEKKYVLRACAVGVGLFFGGVAFCFFFVMARALKFAEWWALWMGVRVPDWRAETYFSFVTKFMLGMGLGFELPVVLLALVKIGILDYQKLSAMRRYMIVINLILGALLTTPEVFTQVVMAIILQILYEISVWIAWYWEWRDRKRAQAAGARD